MIAGHHDHNGDLLSPHVATVELLNVRTDEDGGNLLTRDITFDVPAQDLIRIDCSKLPALPRSRFVIHNVTTAR